MAKEFKQIEFTNIKAESKDRVRVGIAAVHGNIDSWGDRSHVGAFAKTIAEGRARVRHLWMHNSQNPPIATIKELKEIGRDELPPEILDKFPAATGGLKVWREYYDNQLANWVLEAIDKGDVNEMSYAFDVIKADYSEEQNESGENQRIRELRELKLMDTSDVHYGMNPATLASVKGFTLEPVPLGTLYQQFLMLDEQIKSGRRNSESDMTLLQQMHEITISLGATCKTEETDEEKTAKAVGEVIKDKIAEGINSNNLENEAEAADLSTSLNSEWDLRKRRLQILEI